MLKTIRIALRHLFRQKYIGFLNVFGLSVGMAIAALISLYVIDEMSYDKFHKDYKNIYRVCINASLFGQNLDMPLSPAPLAPIINQELPSALSATRLFTFSSEPTIRYGENIFADSKIFYADSTFFDVFDFKIKAENKATALNRPRTLVVTEKTAEKFFGKENPIGKTIEIGLNRTPFEVTGVIDDIPSNSHIKFDLLASFATINLGPIPQWLTANYFTYIKLQDGVCPTTFANEALDRVVQVHIGKNVQQLMGISPEQMEASGNRIGFYLQPIKDIHFKSNSDYELEPAGNLTNVLVMGGTAILILVISAFNYLNLNIANSTFRIKEVGVKKILGANRTQLIFQFFLESFFVSIIALLICSLLIELALPIFSSITHKTIQINFVEPKIILILLIIVGSINIIGSSYPALFLSSFKPTNVLKGELFAGVKKNRLTRVLIILQFLIAALLFSSTWIVNKQINFLNTRDIGFNKENVFVIKRSYLIGVNQRKTFAEELLKIPGVFNVSGSNTLPSGIVGQTMLSLSESSQDMRSINFMFSDHGLVDVLEMTLVNGRYFRKDSYDDITSIVINEAAYNFFEFKDIEGSFLYMLQPEMNKFLPLKIIGVVKDFHFFSQHQQIGPLVISFNPDNQTLISVKINPDLKSEIIESASSLWNQFCSEQPFVYSFLSDDIDKMYEGEDRTLFLFGLFSVLALIVGLIGLLGFTIYVVQRRTKEVGIRRVFGATQHSIIGVLVNDTSILLIASSIISIPLTYALLKYWLQNFAYSISIHFWDLVIPVLFIVIIALVVVTVTVYMISKRNPAETLRYE